jgi:hypothetical protein
MRALAILPAAIITPPAAHAAVELVGASHPASADVEWLALLETERRASKAFELEVDKKETADDRFFAARAAAEAELDRDAGQPWRFIKARPAHEQGDARTEAGIRDYNADCERRRTAKAALDDRLRAEMGMDEVDERYDAACDAHDAAVMAIIAHPSRDPGIIAHKLRLIVTEYGDTNGDLRPLLRSITGEA